MKIKEVMNKTGLTDRAIRLYIDNGLVSPAFSENYTGRKNIEFSDSDVTELCNIATLRKAGFSINEIKLLKLGDTHCRKTLDDFIDKTSKKIENDKEILEKLEKIAVNEIVTLEDICEILNSVTKEKAIPETDSKPTRTEKIAKYFFTFAAVTELLFAFLMVLYIALLSEFKFQYLYPTIKSFDAVFFAKSGIVLFIGIFSFYVLYSYRKKALFPARKKQLIKHITLFIVSVPLLPVLVYLTVYSVFTPNACSKTTSPNDYLIIDEYAQSDSIASFFPKNIPEYASYPNRIPGLFLDFPDTYPNSTKYYYKYYEENFGGNVFTEIYAEWKLLDKYQKYSDFQDYYENLKDKYINMEFENTVTVKTKGDWKCYYYDDHSEENWNGLYLYRIFAYNDKTETLRFIYAERDIRDPVDYGIEIIPHFMNLDW